MAGDKKYTVTVSETATKMLVSHARFLAQASENAALRLVESFDKNTKTLASTPERCPYICDPAIPEDKYRKLLFEKRYLLIFQIKNNTVYIEAMVDCRQDYSWFL